MGWQDFKITLHEDGVIESEVNGMKGKGCEKVLEPIKKLGKSDVKIKKEYYEKPLKQELENYG